MFRGRVLVFEAAVLEWRITVDGIELPHMRSASKDSFYGLGSHVHNGWWITVVKLSELR